MLKLIDEILQQFRICFKREETFSWFVIIVVGIMVRTDMRGVSSIVGCMGLNPSYYETMLHFFRSQAFNLQKIKSKWQDIVLKYISPVVMDGHIILIGDHIKVAKEARYMPGVKKLHQDSENVGKSEYIFGHQFGIIGILAEGKTMQCIPLDIELQDGIDEVNSLNDDSKVNIKDLKKKKKEDTCILKMIKMSAKFIKSKSHKVILLLDAYFTTGEAFRHVEQVNKEQNTNSITLITRAKANSVAFEEPEVPKKRGRCQPRKYGRKIQFKKLFSERADDFVTVTLNLYGKSEIVKYLCMDLIWKPIGHKIRFVLVKTNEKIMILTCSDLSMHPEKIILGYSYRFKIEVSFKILKQVIGGFCYHFWTTAMPKLSRFVTKNDLSKVTEKKDKEKIILTMRAIEVFTFLSCMAMGILIAISLKFPTLIWNRFFGWLRTRSSETPSVETARSVLQQEFWSNTHNLSKHETLACIKKYQKQDYGKQLKSSA
jgi:hypothetical protein